MKPDRSKRFLPLCLALAFISCTTPDSLDIREYYEWMNDPEHGLVRIREIGDVRLTVKYLPSDYLAWLYVQSEGRSDRTFRDSMNAVYRNSLGFLLTLSPVAPEGTGRDIMLSGVSSYQEYVSKFMVMNFRIPELVKLHADGYESSPVLANSENSYGLTTKRDVMLIFPDNPKIWRSQSLTISFDDRIMETGISRFTFNCKQLQSIPLIRY